MFGSEPNVRRSRARKCGRRVAVGVVWRLWRAVRYHDRRRMIDISEMYADRVPAPFVLLNESSADGAARGIAFHRWRIDLVLLRCAAEAAVVLQRNLGGARGGRPALVVVALEQSLAAP